MATIAITIVNPTSASADRGDGVQLAAYTYIAAITLTDAQQGVGLNAGMCMIRDVSTQEVRRLASKILRLGKNPGSAVA
ncbi:MAG: hypothetical protein H0U53_00665 [Actinobacteria bacterium]|nr:hypothetical protein [Actinomycetota bacterium]